MSAVRRVTLRLTSEAADLLIQLAGSTRKQGMYVSAIIAEMQRAQQAPEDLAELTVPVEQAYQALQLQLALSRRLLNPEGRALREVHRYAVAGVAVYRAFCPQSGLEHACPPYRGGGACPGHVLTDAVRTTVLDVSRLHAEDTALRALLPHQDARWQQTPEVIDQGRVPPDVILRALGPQAAPILPGFEHL